LKVSAFAIDHLLRSKKVIRRERVPVRVFAQSAILGGD